MTTQIIEMDEFLVDGPSIDIKKRLGEIVSGARGLAVNCEDSFRKITGLYAESKDWEKRIEFIRKQSNQPDQDRINARNDKAKELLTPLKEIQSIAKEKTAQYQLMLEEARREEEAKMAEGADLLGLSEAPEVAPVPQSQRGDGAILYKRTVRKFRIVDRAKIPAKYLKVDEEAIERDIKLGIGEIEGVSIYEEEITQLRTR